MPGARVVLVLLAALGSGACSLLLPRAPVPLRTIPYETVGAARPPALAILLPGRGGAAEDYASHGFVAAARAHALPADLVACDATIGYYARRTLLGRLRTDVVEPARRRGYQRLWLVGISMGGVGALLYAREYPEDVSGVILIAPFLGDEKVLRSVEQAGGLDGWRLPTDHDPEDWQPLLWDSLRRLGAGTNRAEIPVWLGYGLADRFARAHALLARALPPAQVFTRPGGHDWDAWCPLWHAMLDTWTARPPATAGARSGPWPGLGSQASATERSSW